MFQMCLWYDKDNHEKSVVYNIAIFKYILEVQVLIDDTHEKQQTSSVDDSLSDGGNALPSNFTTETLASLGATIYLIHCCLKCFDHNYLARSNMYIENMQDFL